MYSMSCKSVANGEFLAFMTEKDFSMQLLVVEGGWSER